MSENKSNRMTFSKIILIFIIGSIAGYLFETSYYFIKHGVFMNKQGLLYGPIKPIYGFGCVILSLLLNFVKDKKTWTIFVYGSIVGGIFEYLCSVILELFFKTRMWNYSNMGLDINGRVFIPYLPIWGLIALLWLKIIFPRFNEYFDKIPKKIRIFLTIFLSVFMIFNATISTVAVWRMRDRANNIPAKNFFERFLDRHYTDEYIMKRIPYLKIVD